MPFPVPPILAGLLALGVCGITSCSKPAVVAPPEKVIFPIGGFSTVPERDQAAGFTLAGPVYSKEKEILARCEAVGLPFIYPVGVRLDFLGKKGGPAVTTLDVESLRNQIRDQVAEVATSPTIVAWYLRPEELRHWMPLEMEYLRVASETIREADPQKRPVWMYEPNHRNVEALEKTLPYQQICGKGLYANYTGRKNGRAWIAWSLSQQKKAVASSNHNAALMAVLEMFQSPADEDRQLIRIWVRHDSYTALLNGAKMITIFSFAKRKDFDAWGDYYSAYSEVARELNDSPSLGAVFLRGKNLPSPPLRVIEGPSTVRVMASKKEPVVKVPSFQAQVLTYQNQAYLFIVNSSSSPLILEIGDSSGWKPIFSGQPIWRSARLALTPWEVAAFHRLL